MLIVVVLAALVGSVGLVTPAAALVDGFVRVGPLNGESAQEVSASANGRFVAFSAIGDDGLYHVYLRDMASSTAQSIAVDGNGVPLVGDSLTPQISPSGRFVAFKSRQASQQFQTWLYDTTTGRSTLASVNTNGQPSNSYVEPRGVSDNGRVLMYSVGNADLVASPDPHSEAFVRDVPAGTTQQIPTVTLGGFEFFINGSTSSISADGSTVLVYLARTCCNAPAKLGAWDVATHTFDVVSDPAAGSANDSVGFFSVSSTGRYVVFNSRATNLLPGGGGIDWLYWKDRDTGELQRLTTRGAPLPAHAVSDDGRYVGFASQAGDIDPTQFIDPIFDPTGTHFYLYVFDRSAGTAERLTNSVQANAWYVNKVAFAPTSRQFAFQTIDVLVPGSPAGSSVYLTRGADTTAPIAAPTAAPSPNAAGWNNTDVTVTWNWADEPGGSGIDSAHCTTSSTSNGQGSITLTATCQDLAGNQGTASGDMKIDTTPPSLSPVVVPNPVYLHEPATASPGATDPGAPGTFSGIASATCAAPDTSTLGTKVVACTATDRAGNSASATVSYTVVARVPSDKDDCKKDGWRNLVDDTGRPFANQGDCVSYVATKGKNKAKG